MMPRNEPPTEGPAAPGLPAAKIRAGNSQPAELLLIDGTLLTLATIMKVTGLGKTKIYEMMRAGMFPQSVKVGIRSVRWRAEEIRVWNARRGHTA
ncbi:MAG TPA: AlpA family phage regulatory protein [Xanthobacteraceae bacterium]|nr:AlpA family phage regulatory protein [Xanthobacteraceae bacterium]